MPPIVINLLNLRQSALDLGFTIRVVMTGAAPLGADELSRFRKIWPKTSFRQAYGLTETCTVVTQLPVCQGLIGGKTDSCAGVILMGQELLVVNPETQKSVLPGEQGELWVRGKKYYPGASAEILSR